MKRKQPPLLAIHLTAKGFGYVVMSAPFSLVDWGTRSASEHKNASCLVRLAKLLDRHDPHTVVIEDPTQGKGRSNRIIDLSKSIATLCHSQSIDLATFSRADMYRCYATVGAKSWQDVAEAVGRQLEPLRKLVPSRRKAWQSEHRRMSVFMAAAMAITYWQLADTSRLDLS